MKNYATLDFSTNSYPPLIGLLKFGSLRGDKVSTLTHIYPNKPLRKTKVTIWNSQADSLLYVRPDV